MREPKKGQAKNASTHFIEEEVGEKPFSDVYLRTNVDNNNNKNSRTKMAWNRLHILALCYVVQLSLVNGVRNFSLFSDGDEATTTTVEFNSDVFLTTPKPEDVQQPKKEEG